MTTRVRSLALNGIEGYEVSVETDISGGLPSFDIVGLPDAAVKESRERVRPAVKNCGYSFPARRITVNLAPANTRKVGSVYDLPILLSVLQSAGAIEPVPEDAAFVGELSLYGELRPIDGILAMATAAGEMGFRRLYCPAENGREASYAGNIEVYPVETVAQLLEHLQDGTAMEPMSEWNAVDGTQNQLDYADVMGQQFAKRAIEVAASGGHNILLMGPPGAGKSMLTSRIPSILPSMTRDEILETTKIYSVAGLLSHSSPLVSSRPFRAPHHTTSASALAGGGTHPKPGEISLAHNGVLFLDELPQFNSDVLESLRQPLEDGKVTISRVAGSLTFPSRFMLVCAMNPCRCGWYGHPSGRCTCTERSVADYRSRVSGPILDRIDIHIEVPSLEYDELRERAPSESSADIKARVNAARDIQRKRYQGYAITNNAQISSSLLHEFCVLDESCEKLMRSAFDRLGLTARSYDRILRVARTIADLDGGGPITPAGLAEAIQYRSIDPAN